MYYIQAEDGTYNYKSHNTCYALAMAMVHIQSHDIVNQILSLVSWFFPRPECYNSDSEGSWKISGSASSLTLAYVQYFALYKIACVIV